MYGGDNSIHLTIKLATEMSQIKIQTVKDAIAAPMSCCIDSISIATDQYKHHRGHWDSADVMGTL